MVQKKSLFCCGTHLLEYSPIFTLLAFWWSLKSWLCQLTLGPDSIEPIFQLWMSSEQRSQLKKLKTQNENCTIISGSGEMWNVNILLGLEGKAKQSKKKILVLGRRGRDANSLCLHYFLVCVFVCVLKLDSFFFFLVISIHEMLKPGFFCPLLLNL